MNSPPEWAQGSVDGGVHKIRNSVHRVVLKIPTP